MVIKECPDGLDDYKRKIISVGKQKSNTHSYYWQENRN